MTFKYDNPISLNHTTTLREGNALRTNLILLLSVVFIIVSLFPLPSHCQEIIWHKIFGDTLDYDGFFYNPAAIFCETDGGYVLGAYVIRTIDYVDTTCLIVIKTDADGEVVWEYNRPFSSVDDMVRRPGGGYFIVGNPCYEGRVAKPQLICLNSEGEEEWCREYIRDGVRSPPAAMVLSDEGRLLIIGERYLEGDSLTYREYDLGVHNYFRDICQVDEDRFIITGTIQERSRHERVMIMEVDSEGDSAYYRIHEMEQTAVGIKAKSRENGGGFVVACHVLEWFEDYSLGDAMLCEFDQNGDLMWEEYFHGDDTETPRDLYITASGHLVLTGRSNSTEHRRMNGWIVLTDEEGLEEMNIQVSCLSYNELYAVTADRNGNIIAFGITASHFRSPYSMLWLVKLEAPVYVEESPSPAPVSFSVISAYPNPFNASVSIRFQTDKPSLIRSNVFDLNGRKIFTIPAGNFLPGNHVITWDTHSLNIPSGEYLFQINDEKTSNAVRVVLIR